MGSTLALAGAGELGIGTLDERILSTDTEAAVRVWGRRESTSHRERSYFGGLVGLLCGQRKVQR